MFASKIHAWLQGRDRYLNDMVRLVHDRFGMVCSTTTCCKMK
jgi:hypothetical protein